MVNPPRVFGFSLRWVCTRLASSELHLSPLLFLNLGAWCHQSSLSAFLPPSPAWHDMTSGRPSWTQVSNIRYHPCLRGLSSRLVTSWVITSVNTKTPKNKLFWSCWEHFVEIFTKISNIQNESILDLSRKAFKSSFYTRKRLLQWNQNNSKKNNPKTKWTLVDGSINLMLDWCSCSLLSWLGWKWIICSYILKPVTLNGPYIMVVIKLLMMWAVLTALQSGVQTCKHNIPTSISTEYNKGKEAKNILKTKN